MNGIFHLNNKNCHISLSMFVYNHDNFRLVAMGTSANVYIELTISSSRYANTILVFQQQR